MLGKKLDQNNDITISSDQFETVDRGRQTVQHVRTRLLFYLNEWFLDTGAGTPYFEAIFIKPVDLANVEAVLKTRILQTPDIERLIEFFMDYNANDRKLQVIFSAETTWGEVLSINQVLI